MLLLEGYLVWSESWWIGWRGRSTRLRPGWRYRRYIFIRITPQAKYGTCVKENYDVSTIFLYYTEASYLTTHEKRRCAQTKPGMYMLIQM